MSEAPARGAPLALTMGEPAGIAGEITVGAWASGRVRQAFFIIADPDWLGPIAEGAGARIESITRPGEAPEIFARALPVLPLRLAVPAKPGKPNVANAAGVIAAIERAVALVRSGEAAAVVTNPIMKRVLITGAGFAFPGHTEFLAHLANVSRVVMMLAAPELRVVPVTVHIPLAEVPARLSAALIEDTARITVTALRRDFGLAEPRLAVAGLNPHAGEGGVLGREELEIIAPALERLRAEGIAVEGPLAADTMFHAAARTRYDAALAMYHDQALIPLKTLDFARGVNVTLGLPFVRTSPDHGPALDIAGTGRADPTSLIEALNLAAAMAARRASEPA